MNDGQATTMTKEQVEFLEQLKKEKEAKEAKERADAEIKQKRDAVRKSLEEQGIFKELEGTPFAEEISKDPSILDGVNTIKFAIEKHRLEKKLADVKPAGAPEPKKDDGSPDNPGKSGGDSSIPEYGTAEFFKGLSSGAITSEMIDKYDLKPEAKVLLKLNLPTSGINSEYRKFFGTR